MEFDYERDYVFEDDEVKLSPLSKAHFDSLSTIARDPVIWQYLVEDGLTEDSLHRYLNEALAQRLHRSSYPFVVYNKKQETVAGTTRLYELNPDLGNIKMGHTWYGKNHRGTGINKKVKYLLFQFLFEKLKISRIGFGVHELNIRSIRALESMGIKKEGVLRQFLPGNVGGSDDYRYDIVLFSLLENEWSGLRSSLEKVTVNPSI